MVLPNDISSTTWPGPSMMLRPASPNVVPFGFTHVLADPEVWDGAQNAAVLNHWAVVGLWMEIGCPVTSARTEPLTPRLMSNPLPSTRGVKCKPDTMVKSPLHCPLFKMCDTAPLDAPRWLSPNGKS